MSVICFHRIIEKVDNLDTFTEFSYKNEDGETGFSHFTNNSCPHLLAASGA